MCLFHRRHAHGDILAELGGGHCGANSPVFIKLQIVQQGYFLTLV